MHQEDPGQNGDHEVCDAEVRVESESPGTEATPEEARPTTPTQVPEVGPTEPESPLSPALSKQEETLVRRVAKRQERLEHDDMAAAHQIGKLLNERFGSPLLGQSGMHVLQEIERRLGIPQSELALMRKFEDYVTNLAEAKHWFEPRRWSEVKDHMKELFSPQGSADQRKAPQPPRRLERLVERMKGNWKSRFERVEVELTRRDREELRGHVAEFSHFLEELLRRKERRAAKKRAEGA
jgi:hypothetical protein